jgi:hypothetical protein
MTEPSIDTKEIDSCTSCPMYVRMRYVAKGMSGICSHWGSPEGNNVASLTPPKWCPIRKKPLLLKVIP